MNFLPLRSGKRSAPENPGCHRTEQKNINLWSGHCTLRYCLSSDSFRFRQLIVTHQDILRSFFIDHYLQVLNPCTALI